MFTLTPSDAAPRGQIVGDDGLTNFARAVNAATEDTRDKWATFQEKLRAAYKTPLAAGSGRTWGDRMICLLAKDTAQASTC